MPGFSKKAGVYLYKANVWQQEGNSSTYTALAQLVAKNNPYMNPKWLVLLIVVSFLSCTKTSLLVPQQEVTKNDSISSGYMVYRIPAGSHACTNNVFREVRYAALSFNVTFDSSAVYTCRDPRNQYDINKLYGFADNNTHHHYNSARFGWRWSSGALRLFAYVYNDGKLVHRELDTVTIGKEYKCSIAVSGNEYLFTLNDHTTAIYRSATTTNAEGYKLYPYFGGDEAAPHDINISITESR